MPARNLQLRALLARMQPDVLTAHGVVLAGGSPMVMRHGDYRPVNGAYFVCGSASQLARLRAALTRPGAALATLFRPATERDARMLLLGEVQANMSSVTLRVMVGPCVFRFEFVHQPDLDILPAWAEPCCGVPAAHDSVLAALKAQANLDRWRAPQFGLRDVLDLALGGGDPIALLQGVSWASAPAARGSVVEHALHLALQQALNPAVGLRLPTLAGALHAAAVRPSQALVTARLAGLADLMGTAPVLH